LIVISLIGDEVFLVAKDVETFPGDSAGVNVFRKRVTLQCLLELSAKILVFSRVAQKYIELVFGVFHLQARLTYFSSRMMIINK
jgi:hypothetical protein